jgi:hypothetical protein
LLCPWQSDTKSEAKSIAMVGDGIRAAPRFSDGGIPHGGRPCSATLCAVNPSQVDPPQPHNQLAPLSIASGETGVLRRHCEIMRPLTCPRARGRGCRDVKRKATDGDLQLVNRQFQGRSPGDPIDRMIGDTGNDVAQVVEPVHLGGLDEVYMAAARVPPESAPANRYFLRVSAISRPFCPFGRVSDGAAPARGGRRIKAGGQRCQCMTLSFRQSFSSASRAAFPARRPRTGAGLAHCAVPPRSSPCRELPSAAPGVAPGAIATGAKRAFVSDCHRKNRYNGLGEAPSQVAQSCLHRRRYLLVDLHRQGSTIRYYYSPLQRNSH